jgi:hypothetical protein
MDAGDVERSFADYLWIANSGSRPFHMHPAVSRLTDASASAPLVEKSENQPSNQLHLENPQ